MKKIKLLTILTPITVAIGVVAPLATSCVPVKNNSDTKEGDKKNPSLVKLNNSNVTSLKDINNVAEPFCILNTAVYYSSSLTVTYPTTTNVQLQYQTGAYNGEYQQIEWNGEWTSLTKGQTFNYEIEHTKPIRFRAYNSTTPGEFSTSTDKIYFAFESGGHEEPSVMLGGSLLSLVCRNADYSESSLELVSPYTFTNLFNANYSRITDVSVNLLPFTTLTESCYEGMFYRSYNLQTAPALPATTLAKSCYKNMFYECYALLNAPHLPAKKLAESCYESMFYNCDSMKSISLSYVGNFEDASSANASDANTYFTNWVGCSYNNNPTVPQSGTIYYNGLDTQKGYKSAIPTNFNIVQNKDFIDQNTIDVQFNNDSTLGTQTSILPSTKDKVRIYKDWTLADARTCLPPVNRKSAGTIKLVYRDKDGNVLAETKTVSEINQEAYLSYYKDKSVVVEDAVTLFANKASVVKVQQFTTTGWMKIKIDDNDWVDVTAKKEYSIPEGSTVLLKGNLGNKNLTSSPTQILITGDVDLRGSAMNLLLESTEAEAPTELVDYAFFMTFEDCTGITSVSDNFLLPPGKDSSFKMDLKNYCYRTMFRGCTSLKNAPIIPMSDDISGADSCCAQMFNGCTSLVKAPELPATKLPAWGSGTMGVYELMFYGCTSLTDGPSELPATAVPKAAYNRMFQKCTSLTNAPKILANEVTGTDKLESAGWCADGEASSIPRSGMYGMFYGCTNLETAPEMKYIGTGTNKTLGKYAMYHMFNGCTALENASNIAIGQVEDNKGTLILSANCLFQMFINCSALKYAPDMRGINPVQPNNISNETNNVGKPEPGPGGGGGEESSSSKKYYCYQMFYGCSSLVVNTTKEGGVEFFTCFNYSSTTNDTDYNIYQMFNGTTPTSGATYYYHV